jgi:exosortase A
MKLYEADGRSPNAPGVVLLPAIEAWADKCQDIETSTSFRRTRTWKISCSAIWVGLAILIALYWKTAASAVHFWMTSSAYNYAVLIAPISVYFIWEDRAALARMAPAPGVLGLAVTAVFAGGWFLGSVLHINEGQHLGLVGMMEGLFLAVLGWTVSKRLAFPLLYLFLMVPTGDFLLEPLRHLSFAGSVALLEFSGIPVYGENLTIQVPSGSFFVEAGCAGLNFLLTSLALSLVFGKLVYRRISSQILCVATALAIAMIANIVRIYLIIALTEWSHRRIAIADDHLTFGWGFFAVVMMVTMWLGGKVKERAPEAPRVEPATAYAVPSPHRIIAFTALVVAIAVAASVLEATSGAALGTWIQSFINVSAS